MLIHTEQQKHADVFRRFSTVRGTADDIPLALAKVKKDKALAPMHSHLFHELAIVLSGTGTYRTPTSTFRISPGDVFMLNPGMMHEYSEQKDLTVINILFWPDKLNLSLYDLVSSPGYRAFFELEPQSRDQTGFNGRLTLNMDDLETIQRLLWHLQEELDERKDGFLLMAASYMSQVFTLICRAFSSSEHAAHHELLRVEQVLEYMQNNYSKRITRSELAEVALMSESSLYRRFTQLLGKPPLQYLIELRLAKAAELLQNSDRSITDIALRCGFSDGNYFGMLFKKHKDIAPHQYRLQIRRKKLTDVPSPHQQD